MILGDSGRKIKDITFLVFGFWFLVFGSWFLVKVFGKSFPELLTHQSNEANASLARPRLPLVFFRLALIKNNDLI